MHHCNLCIVNLPLNVTVCEPISLSLLRYIAVSRVLVSQTFPDSLLLSLTHSGSISGSLPCLVAKSCTILQWSPWQTYPQATFYPWFTETLFSARLLPSYHCCSYECGCMQVVVGGTIVVAVFKKLLQRETRVCVRVTIPLGILHGNDKHSRPFSCRPGHVYVDLIAKPKKYSTGRPGSPTWRPSGLDNQPNPS